MTYYLQQFIIKVFYFFNRQLCIFGDCFWWYSVVFHSAGCFLTFVGLSLRYSFLHSLRYSFFYSFCHPLFHSFPFSIADGVCLS